MGNRRYGCGSHQHLLEAREGVVIAQGEQMERQEEKEDTLGNSVSKVLLSGGG